MKKVQGLLTQSDMGSGGYLLKTQDGSQYSLHGPIPNHLLNKNVVVEGRPVMSMMMMGEALEVVSITESTPESSRPQK